MAIVNNITNVRGIKCWGAHTGIKSLRRDLAIIYSEKPAVVSATFTKNKIQAHPIKITKEHIKDGRAQAIVINSGNANACNGPEGFEAAQLMARTTAEKLKLQPEDVLVASTGIIGEAFPTDKVLEGIQDSIPNLSSDSKAGSLAANAILTTDTFAKEGHVSFIIDGIKINIGAMAKGSGMIHPNMGTMLSFAVTDLDITQELLDKAFKEVVNDTFNMITVDGDTSTNDTAILMANGMAGNKKIESESDPHYALFKKELYKITAHLAELIISDGEGATKVIEYLVTGAENKDSARKLVRSISTSVLVKTALFGRDSNWGRIICAAGNAPIEEDLQFDKMDLYIGNEKQSTQILKGGEVIPHDKLFLKKLLRDANISIHLELNQGKAEAKGWGTDLSTDYVLFNSVYTT